MRLLALLCAFCGGVLAGVIPGLAHGSAQATAQLTWAGWDDQVGAWWQTTPDGYRDGHFVFTVNAPGATLTGLSLNPVKVADGTVNPTDWWDATYKSAHWPLGVSRNGSRLNLGFQPLCDPVGAGSAVYDIYAEDDGSLNTGITFRVTATFADGSKVTADAVLTNGAGGLPRAPRPFAFPTVPRPDANAACVASAPAPTSTTTTSTPAPPKSKPKTRPKSLPVCRKGQKSTAKKPCRRAG